MSQLLKELFPLLIAMLQNLLQLLRNNILENKQLINLYETLKNNDGFGNEIYAKEELRAELTSMFLQQRYNVNFDEKHYENHAAYLQSWAKVIKNDPNEIYRAAADAEKAMSYIETRMINKNLTKDKEKSVQKEITLENKTPKRIIKQKITMKIDTQKSKSKERTLTR